MSLKVANFNFPLILNQLSTMKHFERRHSFAMYTELIPMLNQKPHFLSGLIGGHHCSEVKPKITKPLSKPIQQFIHSSLSIV